MKEKTLGIILGLLNIILIAVCVVFFLEKDKTLPVIVVGECSFVYEEELPREILYQGVTAYDEEAGDLTEQVVIEKIVTDRENGKATITYGVSDASGNVGKATRTLEMPVLTRIQFPNAGEAGAQEEATVTTENQEEAAEETTETEDAETLDETEEGNAAGENEDTTNPEEETDAENAEETAEENEESETTENEGEDTTGGNVTVVGSNNRRN